MKNVPMPKKNLSNMEIDEISLVDKGANQFAMVAIAKRAPEEDHMPELYNENGELLDESALEHGDVVYDETGQAFQFVEDDAEAEDHEPELVGKSAFFQQAPAATGFAAAVREELSKAYTDEARDEIITKALGRVEELEAQQNQLAEIAKSERDLRLTREYISKAAEFNVPVAPEALGPVLLRMAEQMSYEDCSVIAKCLESAGTDLFDEVGQRGGGANGDIMREVQSHAAESFGKSLEEVAAEDVSKVFDLNPAAYDEYLSAQRGL